MMVACIEFEMIITKSIQLISIPTYPCSPNTPTPQSLVSFEITLKQTQIAFVQVRHLYVLSAKI